MNDLVKKLRGHSHHPDRDPALRCFQCEAADRIEELEAEKAGRIKTFEEWKKGVVEAKELADSVIVTTLEGQLDKLQAEKDALEQHANRTCEWRVDVYDDLRQPTCTEYDDDAWFERHETFCPYCGGRVVETEHE